MRIPLFKFFDKINYEVMLVLFVILISKSLYFEAYGQNLLFIPLLMLVLYKNMLVSLNKYAIYYCVTFAFISVLSLNAALSTLTILCIRLYLGVIIISTINFKTFSRFYSQIIIFLGLMSLLAIPISFLGIPSLLPNFGVSDGRSIQNFIFFGVSGLGSDNSFRNIGLWWEPGAFAVFMNLAFLFSIINKEITVKKYILYLFLTLSISSTTGLIVFLLLSILVVNLKNKTLFMKVNIVIVVASVLTLFVFYAAEELFSKFDPDSLKFVSFLSRYYDVVISYGLFMKYPFFGYGLGTPFDRVQVMASDLVGISVFFTSAKPTGADGITFLIAQIGFFGVFLIIPFLFPRYARSLNWLQRGVVALALFLTFNTENLSYSLIFTVLTLYGVTETPNKEET